MLAELQHLARNTFFDEQPCPETSLEDIDFRAASEFFSAVSRPLTARKRRSLGLVVSQGPRELSGVGALLLFGKTRGRLFPSATIRCGRFLRKDTARFLDHTEIDEHLPKAVDSAVMFVECHTRQGIQIGCVFRELGLIEQWGCGLGRITSTCRNAGLPEPRFEELGRNFRVTLFGERVKAPAKP